MTAERDALRAALARASHTEAHELERFLAQMEFADGLCALHPTRAAAWRKLVKKATERARAGLGRGGAALMKAVREAEASLAPLAAAAKKYTVHCVGHAHIDMNWMWSWPETVAVTNDTFSTVLRLMDEFPGFRFSQSQASVYAIVEKHNPPLLARIAERVREGRWEVTASHWVEGDKNLSGGESLCRHLLYTRRYMQQLFGLAPEDVPIDWSPDTFGHAVTVPTYLVRGGVKYLYLHRPGVHGPPRPPLFWWRGPDGARVLVRNDMVLAYNGRISPDLGRHILGFVRDTGVRDMMFVYGVGDHGGGPTRRDLLRAVDMQTWPVFPHIRFSTARDFFAAAEQAGAKLPVLDCELNTEFTGCYTSQSLIKKSNRIGENRLGDAEVAATLAWGAAARPYPHADLLEGWRDTLFSHFHDILPGSGVHDTRTYTHGLFQKTVAMTGMVETAALRGLAALVDTSSAGAETAPEAPPSASIDALGAGVGFGSAEGRMSAAEQSAGRGPRPFVLFNPTAWDRDEVVEATIWDNALPGATTALKDRRFAVRLGDGRLIPAQMATSGRYWGHEYVTLAFPARVAGLGYALYAIVEETAPAVEPGVRHLGREHHCKYARYERGPEGMENDLVRVELDPATGGIRSLVDKRSGLELITAAGAAPALEYAVERPHGMSSWSIDHTGPVEAPTVTAIKRTLNGPHKAALEVAMRIHESDFVLTYELRAGDPRVYLKLQGTWFQRGTPETGVPSLRLALPLTLEGASARYEIPFGAIDRPYRHDEEAPALQWAQVSGKIGARKAGCLLLNDSKYGHALDGSTLRLTLIRSSYQPDPLPEIGRHEMQMALLPFAGELSVAAATRRGRELNHALRVVGADVHAGPLPARGQFVKVAPDNLIVSGLKKAEDDDAIIVRLYETAGKRTVASLRFDAKRFGKAVAATEVDLLERPVAKSTARLVQGAVKVAVPARGIASVIVRFQRQAG